MRVAATLVVMVAMVWGDGGAATAPRASVAPAASEGCKKPARSPREVRVRMTSGGARRAYWQHVPPAARDHPPLPVVIDLHGYLESAAVHKAHSALGPFGDQHGFVTITPEGSGPIPRWETPFDSLDMRFFGDLLDQVGKTLCIDERRVFVTGYSNGAFMTSAVACVYADRVSAVAPVAGIRAVPGCTPSRAVPVVGFHGTADEWIEFTGGLGPEVDALPQPDQQQTRATAEHTESGLSIPGVAAAWATRNGCASAPREESVEADVRLVRYDCPRHADVRLYEIAGGGHTWPGSAFSRAIEPYVGPTTFSIDANAVMWRFFQRHPLPRS